MHEAKVLNVCTALFVYYAIAFSLRTESCVLSQGSMGESMPCGVPIAASALTFGATHLALRLGPVHRRLERMYVRRKEAGLIQPSANPPQLASQAGSRILNEIHNLVVVRVAIGGLRLCGIHGIAFMLHCEHLSRCLDM